MFDRIVLGFFMERNMTGYDIKKTMETSTNFFFNTSFGNIYPTLKKLEESGFLVSYEEVKNGKLNKVYSITDDGRKVFIKWLRSDSDIAMIRDEALCRVFFFQHLENEEIKNELITYLQRLDIEIEKLKNLRKKHQCGPDTWKLKTLDYGIDYYSHMKKSYNKMLNDIK
jgi:DNA-binding PadR family transcriptional regulator